MKVSVKAEKTKAGNDLKITTKYEQSGNLRLVRSIIREIKCQDVNKFSLDFGILNLATPRVEWPVSGQRRRACGLFYNKGPDLEVKLQYFRGENEVATILGSYKKQLKIMSSLEVHEGKVLAKCLERTVKSLFVADGGNCKGIRYFLTNRKNDIDLDISRRQDLFHLGPVYSFKCLVEVRLNSVLNWRKLSQQFVFNQLQLLPNLRILVKKETLIRRSWKTLLFTANVDTQACKEQENESNLFILLRYYWKKEVKLREYFLDVTKEEAWYYRHQVEKRKSEFKNVTFSCCFFDSVKFLDFT